MEYIGFTAFVILCVACRPVFSHSTRPTTPGPTLEPFDIRLVDGPTASEGRLEVRHQGTWGTVCDDGFELPEADVVCRQLGYDFAKDVKNHAFYGKGNGNILLDDINCQGDEKALSQCSDGGWGSHDCVPREDAGVQCGNITDGEILFRLSNSYRPRTGNVQAFYNGSWGYICTAGWRFDEANVACRHLGYVNGASGVFDYRYNYQDINYVISSIDCQGDETNLTQCEIKGVDPRFHPPNTTMNPLYNSTCGNTKAAGVICRVGPGPVGLSKGKIAGITVICILLVTMLVVIPLIFLRCKKPKNTQTQTDTATPGQPIPSGPTTVMYMNSPTGASQMVPDGSPPVAYGQSGQPVSTEATHSRVDINNTSDEPETGAAGGGRILTTKEKEKVPLM